MPFELPKLPYAYDALEPFMSRETLEYHHDKHHKTYVETTNKLIEGSGLEGKSLEDVVRAAYRDPAKKKLFNNAAQHWNHSQFWQCMKPKGGSAKIPDAVAQKIGSDLGGFEKFEKDFVEQGVGQFGSGWVWLALDHGKLEIVKTPDAENPLIQGKTTLLTCDVWEHAYYIDQRNAREKYLNVFLDSLVNWDRVAELLDAAQSRKAA